MYKIYVAHIQWTFYIMPKLYTLSFTKIENKYIYIYIYAINKIYLTMLKIMLKCY